MRKSNGEIIIHAQEKSKKRYKNKHNEIRKLWRNKRTHKLRKKDQRISQGDMNNTKRKGVTTILAKKHLYS